MTNSAIFCSVTVIRPTVSTLSPHSMPCTVFINVSICSFIAGSGMSCTVSELPSGCRLRGMTASSQQSAANNSGNNGNGNGNGGGGGVVGGGGSLGGVSPTVGGSVGILGSTSNVLQESNATTLQRPQSQKPCCFCWCCCCSCSWWVWRPPPSGLFVHRSNPLTRNQFLSRYRAALTQPFGH